MSSEMATAAVEAVQQSTMQDPAALSHAISAQRFEAELANSSESGATSFRELAESHRKVGDVQRERLQTSSVSEVAIQPGAHGHEFGKDITSYLDGFSVKSKEYMSEVNNITSRVDKINTVSSPETGAPSSSAGSNLENNAAFDPSAALRLMEHSYEFSIEAHLLSNVVSQSTGIFNTLMKEQ